MSYIWPLILMIVSNTVYHVCAKSLPTKLDPLASLTVSYFFAAISSGILYFVVNRGSADLLREYSGMNWVPFLLGLVLVGMEAGSIYAYRAGWSVSTLQVTSAAGIAALLVFVGYLAYQGHHPQQAHRPCLLRRGALFPQQMSCAAPARVV